MRGARNQPLQKVVSWIRIADRSPASTDPSRRHVPPSVRVLPSNTRLPGCAAAKSAATSRMPRVWQPHSDSRVTGMYLERSEVVPDDLAKSVTRPGAATLRSPASIRSRNGR